MPYPSSYPKATTSSGLFATEAKVVINDERPSSVPNTKLELFASAYKDFFRNDFRILNSLVVYWQLEPA